MKRRQVLALAGVLLVVGVLVPVDPAAAKRTPVDFWEVSCQMLDGMPPFPSDDGVHLRGGVSEAVLYVEGGPDGAMIVGSDTVVGNIDFDPITGDGRAFGVFTLIYLPTPGSPTGTYDGTFNGTLNLFDGSFSGRAVGRGTGNLRHQKMRLRLEAEEPPGWLTDYLEGNPPPCGEAARFFHDTGFINHPNRR